MNFCLLAFFALCLDFAVGESIYYVHPVVLIGKWISFVDKRWNHPSVQSQKVQRWFGVMLLLTTLLLSGVSCFILLRLSAYVSVWLWFAVSVIMISSTIAWRGLVDSGRSVYRALQNEELTQSRAKVSMIVGRDTDNLSEQEVIRATVETLAENIVDAIVSPCLYACLGGPVLAILYRAVNTLDSMVGYKNERYQCFGWASAKLDDILNYVPARLAAFLLFIVFGFQRLHIHSAWCALLRDAKHHPSPNSGIPEAMVAGGLGVELGGTNFYQGIPSHRAKMGISTRSLQPIDISTTMSIVFGTGFLLMMMTCVGGTIWWLSFGL